MNCSTLIKYNTLSCIIHICYIIIRKKIILLIAQIPLYFKILSENVVQLKFLQIRRQFFAVQDTVKDTI
jgi:hypothetical protein